MAKPKEEPGVDPKQDLKAAQKSAEEMKKRQEGQTPEKAPTGDEPPAEAVPPEQDPRRYGRG
ncbi:hypothetical protein [Streptomyces sp. NPDC056452]|uniref:hypothetical protein n=1 Tax=Streptomyces sp. NPDC056452 TaxID=3345821 RepID=UPI003698B00A